MSVLMDIVQNIFRLEKWKLKKVYLISHLNNFGRGD